MKKYKNLQLITKFNLTEQKHILDKFLRTFLLNLLQSRKSQKFFKRYEKNFFKKLNLTTQIYRNSQIFHKTQLIRKCWYTKRTRGVYRKYNLSRAALREFIYNGALPYYKKASW